jgi:6,7-dimethyl-8-ribityllumazine synthase
MATAYQNLSDYNPEVLPPAEVLENQRYAIVVADWNPQVTHALLTGVIETLTESGVLKRNINV